MTRIAAPQLSFADLELRNQGVHLDPVLQGIAGFLDDHATLIEQVRPGSGARPEEPPHRTQWHHSRADLALPHPDARQKLGLSRVARTH
jgi:hypothetical protein